MEKCWPILEEMLTLYYPPFRADSDEEMLETSLVGLRRYVLELSSFDRDALLQGWADVIADHKTQGWPTAGAIVQATRKFDRRNAGGYVTDSERSDQTVKGLLRDVLFRGDLGKRAAQEGWCYELRLFLINNARHPSAAEVEHMKNSYQGVERTMRELEAKVAAGEEVIAYDAIRGIYDHMPVREKNLAEQILGGG